MKRRSFGTRSTLMILLLFTFLSCGSNGRSERSDKPLPDPGKIHDKISCASDPGIAYALYIPSGVKRNVRPALPLIILLDPHGSGLLPVQKYRDLAEKKGFILMGSCNSRNGQSPAVTEHIMTTLISEARECYPVDTLRLYISGFSGGSRVASLTALTNRGIEGVIGCGAGFPGMNQLPAIRFNYFGCSGLGDFNLSEMLSLGQMLDRSGVPHFILTFDGSHEWPPAETFGIAMDWMNFKAMKEGKTGKNEALVSSFIKQMVNIAGAYERSGKMVECHSILSCGISALEGLADLSTVRMQLKDIEVRKDYITQAEKRTRLLAEEQTEQQTMMNDLFTKDLTWWNKRIKIMTKKSAGEADQEELMKNKRLLSFLSLLCYSNANAAIRQGNTELAFKVIDIYEVADPGNPEPNYMRSYLLMERSDTANSMVQLEKAIDKGFSDRLRILDQPEFLGLKENRRYFDLLQKIK